MLSLPSRGSSGASNALEPRDDIIDVLQALARTQRRRTGEHLMIIAIGLYQGFTALDAIGPYEVLTYLPGAEMVICTEQKGVVDDHNDLVHLRVDATFADVP